MDITKLVWVITGINNNELSKHLCVSLRLCVRLKQWNPCHLLIKYNPCCLLNVHRSSVLCHLYSEESPQISINTSDSLSVSPKKKELPTHNRYFRLSLHVLKRKCMSDVIIGCESREPYIPGMERTGTGVSSLHFLFLTLGRWYRWFFGGDYSPLIYISLPVQTKSV